MGSDELNPCLSCGACCAFYRASFYWAEANDSPGGRVPVEMTSRLSEFRLVMNGTDQKNPRCVALNGEIGLRVYCSIYECSPSICHSFPVAWENGEPNDMCDKARLAWGLTVLDPLSPNKPGNIPRAA